jgi:glycosyltransferase involved in cell wall biosynthesis
LNILLYSHYFAPSIGGTENIVLAIAGGLSAGRPNASWSEFRVTLVTQTAAGEFDDSRLPFRVLRQPGLRQLWQEIRSSDIVHLAGPALAPLLLGLLARKPVTVEHHGFQTICPTGQLMIEPSNVACPGHFMAGNHLECLCCRSDGNWLVSWKLWLLTFVRRFLCSRVACNIMPTEFLAGLLQLAHMRVIPHGVETLASLRPSPDHSLSPTIVFQGRLVSTKGVRVLLEAAAILRSQNRSFELIIIGDGPDRSGLQRLAQEAQLASRIRFTGRLSVAEAESILATARAVVVPSLAGEVFGLVVAENMARGLAIVASNLGAFTEILGDAGLTFRVGDAADLAGQLAKLLDDPAAATRLGHRAKQRILDLYQRERMVDSHAQLYREVFNSKWG